MNTAPVEFLFDVDNTLLDSERIVDDLRAHLRQAFGKKKQEHYWKIFESLQEEFGYADYLGALQRFRCEKPRDPDFLRIALFLLDYPFKDRLYPQALEVVRHFAGEGSVSIVTDGDVVFQPRKIERSGLFDAVDGRVLVYIHKDQDLDDVERHFPAKHYVVIEDKPQVLAAAKKLWTTRATTVLVRQGKYGRDESALKKYPRADHTVEEIADLLSVSIP